MIGQIFTGIDYVLKEKKLIDFRLGSGMVLRRGMKETNRLLDKVNFHITRT